ncbi:MAG: carboxypeptidase regulatory-like domain-containing protein [Bacteroidales bacterium]
MALLLSWTAIVTAGEQNIQSGYERNNSPFANGVVLFEEDFAGNALPSGWSNIDVTQTGYMWAFDNQIARANSNFTGSGNVHVHTRMISSGFDFSAQEVVLLAMHHRYVSWMTQRGRLKISTDQKNWILVKEYSATTGPAMTWETLDVSQWAAGQAGVYLQWEFDDNQLYGYHWTINQIVLFTPVDHDLDAAAVTGSVGPVLGEENTFEVLVRNKGVETQENYLVHLYDAQHNLIGSQTGVAIAYQQEASFSFQWMPQQTGTTWLYGFVELQEDQIPGNNQTPNFTVNVQQFPTNAIVIGDSTGINSQIPMAFSALSSFTQTIFFDHEFDGGGLLTTLAWKNHFTSEPVNNTPLKIWIGETSQGNLNNGWIAMDNMTLVFDSLVSFPMGTNDIYIDLSEPFLHSGGNLVVSVLRPLAMWGFGGANFVIGETPGHPNRTRRITSNSQQINPQNPGTGTLVSQLPQTTFFLVQAGLGQLSGTVTNAQGSPLHAASIEIEGTSFSTISALDGSYSFPWLLAGEYTVTVSRHGYMTQSFEIVITEDQTTLLDVTMEPLVFISLSGSVQSNDGTLKPVPGARIVLSGMAQHETVSQSDGSFSFHNIFGDITYDVYLSAAGYFDLDTQLTVGDDDMIIDFMLTEFPVPAFSLNTTTATSYTKLNWDDPQQFKESAVVLDDGTAQNGFSSAPGYSMWMGNLFPMSQRSMIRSIEVFGLPHPYGWYREVTIDIFDENRNHIFKTDNLIITPHEWKKVDLPMLPVEGSFYAMIHWNMFTVSTHHIGFDQTGPNVNKNVSYFFDGDEWYLMHEVTMGDPGVFMIRVNAFVEGQDKWVANAENNRNAFYEKELLHYTLFRRAIGPLKDEGLQWETIEGEHTDLSFVDYDWYYLEEGVYEYGLKAIYSNDNASGMRISPTIEKTLPLAHQVTFSIVVEQDIDADAFISLTHTDPLEVIYYEGQASPSGNLVISQVYNGTYHLVVSLEDYEDYIVGSFLVDQDMLVEIVLMPTYIDDQKIETAYVYPNPARDYVRFNSSLNLNKAILINADGQVVKEQLLNSSTGKIHLETLPPGIYLLRLISAEKTIHQRIVIKR